MGKIGLTSFLTLMIIAMTFSFVIADSNVTDSIANSTINETAIEANSSTQEVIQETAQETSPEQKSLEIIYNNIVCKTDFTIRLVGYIVSEDPSAISLSTEVSKLQADTLSLKSYVEANDKSGFKNYIDDVYDVDFQDVKDKIEDWKNSTSISGREKSKLRGDYALLAISYRSCNINSLRSYGEGRVTAFTAILEGYQKKVDELSAKGIDITLLQQVLDDAEDQTVNALKDAVDLAKDSKEIHEAVKSYCLYDGCKDGKNFHLSAKFEIARLKTALDIAKTSENSYKASDKIPELEGSIESADSALAKIGDSAYDADSKKEVWDSINSANSLVKEIKTAFGGK
jgi:hypothetical protein